MGRCTLVLLHQAAGHGVTLTRGAHPRCRGGMGGGLPPSSSQSGPGAMAGGGGPDPEHHCVGPTAEQMPQVR